MENVAIVCRELQIDPAKRLVEILRRHPNFAGSDDLARSV
jgi:hypothetical protein